VQPGDWGRIMAFWQPVGNGEDLGLNSSELLQNICLSSCFLRNTLANILICFPIRCGKH
jgi:hypothetical protein